MRVYYGFEEEFNLVRPVVAVGSFDGVHKGHCRILHYLVRAAQENDVHSVVVTFDPHPQKVLRPESDFFAINSLEENLSLMAQQGVDAVLVIPFTSGFSNLSYLEFIEQYLIDRLHASAVVMGPNHTMGHNREGNHQLVTDFCKEKHLSVIELPELLMHQVGVHSSEIRQAILSNNLALAEEMLGYPYKKIDD